MNDEKENFDGALYLVQCRVLDRLCNAKDLDKAPAEHRALLISLGWKALDSLYDAMESGPNRVAAIRLVLEMAGLLNHNSKSASGQINTTS